MKLDLFPYTEFGHIARRSKRDAVLFAVGTAVIAWVLDSLFEAFVFRENTFVNEFFNPGYRELWMRLIIMFGATVFSYVYLRLRQTGKQLRFFFAVMENAADSMLLRDIDGKILYANNTLAQKLGYSREELTTMSLKDLDPSVLDSEIKSSSQALRHNKTFLDERTHQTKSGQLIPVELLGSYLKVGGREYVLSIIRDIRERKILEQKLRSSQANLTEAQRIAHVGSYVLDLKTGDTQISDELYRLYGRNVGDPNFTLQKTLDDAHPEDQARLRKSIEEDMRDKRPHTSEHRIIWPNGVERWVHCQGELVLGSDGTPLSILGTILDITESKKSELALKKSEERMRLLFEATGEGIIGVDRAGNCTFINPAGLALLGYKDSFPLIGKNLHEAIHHKHPDGTAYPQHECKAYEALRQNKGVHVDDEVFWRADGSSVQVEYKVHPIRLDSLITGAVYVFSDVSSRKAAERRLESTASKLRDANKLKDLFNDVLSHDLMNPASAVKLAAELLFDIEEDPAKAKIISTIQRSSESLIELCSNASKYAKVSSAEQLEFAEHDLATLLKRAIRDLGHLFAEKRIDIHYDLGKEHFARVNLMITDVFLNLISNAIKYSPEGSVVGVEVQDEGDSWVVSIRDQGEGIPDQFKGQVFNRFERIGKIGVKGTGLGLAIAKGIVDLHGGKIWVEDNARRGSIFRVKLRKNVQAAVHSRVQLFSASETAKGLAVQAHLERFD